MGAIYFGQKVWVGSESLFMSVLEQISTPSDENMARVVHYVGIAILIHSIPSLATH